MRDLKKVCKKGRSFIKKNIHFVCVYVYTVLSLCMSWATILLLIDLTCIFFLNMYTTGPHHHTPNDVKYYKTFWKRERVFWTKPIHFTARRNKYYVHNLPDLFIFFLIFLWFYCWFFYFASWNCDSSLVDWVIYVQYIIMTI